MVEYYDDRRKALIKITYGKKKPNSAKKRQYKNSKLNQFGSAQRDALNKMVFIRSMATKTHNLHHSICKIGLFQLVRNNWNYKNR